MAGEYTDLASQYAQIEDPGFGEGIPGQRSGQTPVDPLTGLAMRYDQMYGQPAQPAPAAPGDTPPQAVQAQLGPQPAQVAPPTMFRVDQGAGLMNPAAPTQPLAQEAPAYITDPGPTVMREQTIRPMPAYRGVAGPRRDPYDIAGKTAAYQAADADMKEGMHALGRQELAIADQAIARDERTADLREGAAMARMGREEELARQEEFANNELKKWADDSAKLNEEISKTKIDAGGFWQDKSMGEKVLLGIGGILGGLLAVQPGQNGRNQFMDQINMLVDRDIRAQESNLQNKRASLAQRDNLMSQYQKIHGDRRIAKLQASERLYQSVGETIEAEALRNNSPVARARAEQAKMGIDQKVKELQAAQLEQAVQLAIKKKDEDVRRRAAAAAAQARAVHTAQKEAFDRAVKLEELDIKRKEAEGKDTTFQQRKEIGDIEQKNAQARQTVAPLMKQMQMTDRDGNPMTNPDGTPIYDPKKTLPGLSPAAGWVEGIRNPFTGNNLILSDEAVVNRRSLEQMGLAYRNAITGSGGSVEEAAQIESSLLGSRSEAELQAAIMNANAVLDAKEKAAKATAGPQATTEYETNKRALGGGALPASVRKK